MGGGAFFLFGTYVTKDSLLADIIIFPNSSHLAPLSSRQSAQQCIFDLSPSYYCSVDGGDGSFRLLVLLCLPWLRQPRLKMRFSFAAAGRDAIAICVALLGLYWFAASFFLAKRSLSTMSQCDEDATALLQLLGLSPNQIDRALGSAVHNSASPRNGCWMDRRVDSVVILVVDALRFDFCLYNLPQSVGKRMERMRAESNEGRHRHHHNQTRLFRFVADPPTVTMQRLKALTTGGLPTFADISANFGGASVEEDNWVWQQTAVDVRSRGFASSSLPRSRQQQAGMGFVGDDTWEDLYPRSYFKESYPYPSFNTRDLDTVDNGCLKHLPSLMDRMLLDDGDSTDSNNNYNNSQLEVVVVHFLGVDHVGKHVDELVSQFSSSDSTKHSTNLFFDLFSVGHTYGPHNEHMDTKLKQMDGALSDVLDRLDESRKCHAALIFGDHGMTEDGNHGGGTLEEVSAALFVHVSPSCGELSHGGLLMNKLLQNDGNSLSSFSSWGADSPFASIHQIDLVPTLSFLLGLPIPYANLGGVVPSIIPNLNGRETATALALNAAQVWRYLTVYSETANHLPNLPQLRQHLKTATSIFEEALDDYGDNGLSDDDDRWEQSAALFQHFLAEALALGQRVWTRFDSWGMTSGIAVLAFASIVYALPLFSRSFIGEREPPPPHEWLSSFSLPPPDQYWEVGLAFLFLFFQCGLLTFSNSYILEEEHCAMFFLAVLSIGVALRLQRQQQDQASVRNPALWLAVLLVPAASRMGELYVSGHGLDPSLGVHFAHNVRVFLTSLFILGSFRWYLFRRGIMRSVEHAVADCFTLTCLAHSWWEKSISDSNRNGYLSCRVALLFLFLGIPLSIFQALVLEDVDYIPKKEAKMLPVLRLHESDILSILAKFLIAIMAVTGPSTAATLVLYTFQISALYLLSHVSAATRPHQKVRSVVLAALLKFVTRHVFFATNHGCAFNRLQYSAAFIATKEFYFVTGGISLFLNTFGWEMVGLGWALLWSYNDKGHANLWRTYTCLQLLEAITSCISVSVLRRHLMVWDIYAPHFLFTAIFTVLNGLVEITRTIVAAL